LRENIEGPTTGHSKRRMRHWLLRAGLVLLALATVSCGGPSVGQRAEDPAGDEPAEGEEQAAVDLEHPSLGDEDAPVVLTEYADYQ
jgi:protein-disulfide isomerase